MIAAQLCRGFAHEDSRHERHARHMASDPELVRGNVLIADRDVALRIVEDDGRKLLHFVALGIVATNIVLVFNNVIEVDFRQIDDHVLCRHQRIPSKCPLELHWAPSVAHVRTCCRRFFRAELFAGRLP